MVDREFAIGLRSFKLNKIDAFKQFHIVRKLGPILADLLPAMKDVQNLQKETVSETEKFDGFATIAAPFISGIAKLSDEDANRVLFGLLQSVEVQQMQGNWTRVSSDSMLMIQDLDLSVMLQAAGRAFMYNLSGFFAVLQHQS